MSLSAKPCCADCGAPMDEVETVAVLASLQGHSIFECEWCGHVTLIAKSAARASDADWLQAASAKCRRGISISRASGTMVEPPYAAADAPYAMAEAQSA
jgi:hypothetical protein